MKEKTRIQCDAIQAGLGAVLMQGGRPVEYASRALTPTEERYAQIEKEQLAICFAMERFHTYVYARHVTIEMDHKPLIAIKKAITFGATQTSTHAAPFTTIQLRLDLYPGESDDSV